MRRAFILTSLIIVFCVPSAKAIDCTGSNRNPGDKSLSPSIYINLANLPAGLRSTVAKGAKAWNRGGGNEPGQCPAGGFPQVTETNVGGTQRQITFVFHEGFQPDGTSDACGEFSGTMIVLYESALIGTTTVPCTRADILEDTAAHEMGHAYGLQNSDCGNYIMGRVAYNRTTKT